MSGNVSEFSWSPKSAGGSNPYYEVYCHGGSFSTTGGDSPAQITTKPYGSGPLKATGFRVARTAFLGDIKYSASSQHEIMMEKIPVFSIKSGIGDGAFRAVEEHNDATYEVSGAFYAAKTELTYAKWYEVYTWALDNGYVFANPGCEGNDGLEGAAPSSGNTEPVTNISWREAVVWCNAASEFDGLIPVYWIEESKGIFSVVRTAEPSSVEAGSGGAEKARVSPNADGYRLPTHAEWECAARGGNPDDASWLYTYAGSDSLSQIAVYSASGTAGVKTKVSNKAGLFDMNGNVSEWCWDTVSPTASDRICCGGCYSDSPEHCKVDYWFGNEPASVSSGIGFHVVCTDTASLVPLSLDMVDFSEKTVNKDDVNAVRNSYIGNKRVNGVFQYAGSTPVTVEAFSLAETEVPYDKWYDVCVWALGHGYYFSATAREGCSSFYTGYIPVEPTPGSKVPVLNITWRDAVVWCNAASEREGLTPVYWLEGTTSFSDIANVIRVAKDDTSLKTGTTTSLLHGRIYADAGEGQAENAVINPYADGYRLPTEYEWELAARGGDPDAPEWDYPYAGIGSVDELRDYAVIRLSENDEECPDKPADVRSKKPNSAGLYDMTGNVAEWCSSEEYLFMQRGGSYDDGKYTWCSYRKVTGRIGSSGSQVGLRVARNVFE